MGAVGITNIPSPAFYGQAKDRRDFPLGPEYAAVASNVVIDATGRIAARNGWTQQNTDPIDGGAAILQIHEYLAADGTSRMIFSTADDIFESLAVPTSELGSLTPGGGNWKFLNFNGFCLGWQAGETPIVKNGAGNFADITVSDGGTLPDGNTALAAFGRVWGLDDDKQTIRYSALLDHTAWAVASGGGSIDMRQVWTQGMDEVISIIAFGSNLVVFGRRHIIIWSDGAGSALGLSPTNMYVTDSIDNVGAVARDAVCLVGEVDVMFWSESGIRSLVRTMHERATPINDVSPANRNYIASGKSTATLASIRSVYSPQEGLVLFTAPTLDLTFAFDMRRPIPEGGFRMTEWSLDPSALALTVSGSLYLGFSGNIGLYEGYEDDGATYEYALETGWVDIKGAQARRQALKALKMFMYVERTQAFTVQWGVDFVGLANVTTLEVGENISPAEWGLAEWGIGEWGPVGQSVQKRIPLSNEAEFIKLRLSTTIDAATFGLQPLTVYSKPLRVA